MVDNIIDLIVNNSSKTISSCETTIPVESSNAAEDEQKSLVETLASFQYIGNIFRN